MQILDTAKRDILKWISNVTASFSDAGRGDFVVDK